MSMFGEEVVAQTALWGGWWIVAGVVIVVVLAALLVIARFFQLWLPAYLNNASVRMIDLIGMYLRKVDMATIVFARIQLVKSGLYDMTVGDLETHVLAGGHVGALARSLIAADRAALALNWREACAIDLAGRDLVDAISTSVTPRVIVVPDPAWRRPFIDAVAMDGIQIKAKVCVTVRTNLEQLIGGATEETIIARVGQGVVSAIGSSRTYQAVLENPGCISKEILGKGLDAGTAYEILSIDVADLDVGENIGARLQLAQAAADKRRFQAEAEQRRAMALAEAAEHRARVQENYAEVMRAEAAVPAAMAGAFRSGNLTGGGAGGPPARINATGDHVDSGAGGGSSE